MAVEVFVKIDGIAGESTDDKHKDWLEAISFSMGITHPASEGSTPGGNSSEPPTFRDFSIVKALDKASPKLALVCASGTHIKEVVIELCRAGGDKVKFMEYKLTSCIISSLRSGFATSEPFPVEEVTFVYGKIEWIYTVQKRSDGSGGGNVRTGWDVAANKKV